MSIIPIELLKELLFRKTNLKCTPDYVRSVSGVFPDIEEEEVEPGVNQPLGPVSEARTEEKSDNYEKITLRIGDRWRVIECKKSIQWIIQKRKGNYQERPEWHSVSFCRSREGLKSCLKGKIGELEQDTIQDLERLPSWMGQ